MRAAALVALVACGGEDVDSASPDITPGLVAPSPDSPVLSDSEATCALHDEGDSFWQWDFHCNATDPQGVDDILLFGDVFAYQERPGQVGRVEVGHSRLTCIDGVCEGSDSASNLNADCDRPTSFEFRVYDDEGHMGIARVEGS